MYQQVAIWIYCYMARAAHHARMYQQGVVMVRLGRVMLEVGRRDARRIQSLSSETGHSSMAMLYLRAAAFVALCEPHES